MQKSGCYLLIELAYTVLNRGIGRFFGVDVNDTS